MRTVTEIPLAVPPVSGVAEGGEICVQGLGERRGVGELKGNLVNLWGEETMFLPHCMGR